MRARAYIENSNRFSKSLSPIAAHDRPESFSWADSSAVAAVAKRCARAPKPPPSLLHPYFRVVDP